MLIRWKGARTEREDWEKGAAGERLFKFCSLLLSILFVTFSRILPIPAGLKVLQTIFCHH